MVASLFGLPVLATGASAAGQMLAPTQDINLPSGGRATSALKRVGANGPWYAGPNVHGISSDIPENCFVDQAAYISRHGSRYPDQSAYDGWVDMQERFSASNYTARGTLSFLPDWRIPMMNPAVQMSMENPTGAKEAHDMGYTLRTRYPDLYQDGDEFMVWANNYTRVLQTAQMFVRGYLGWAASTNGSVISVTSAGFTGGIGDSLAPSDSCPAFEDTEGASQVAAWQALWVPSVQERLQALIDGNLTLTADDVTQIPYLCGFESHITGKLSAYCDVFTDEELKDYEYTNDLRYYYGEGPGADLPQTMMTPYLNALVGLLSRGPNITGKGEGGSSFHVPKLLVSFLNDGQLNEIVTASGVFDEQAPLSATEMDDNRLWVGSRYISMRGTIAFERLNCLAANGSSPSNAAAGNETYVRVRLNDAVYPVPSCKSGPGSSCRLSDYVRYMENKLESQGDWITNCNVTTPGAPTTAAGATFYTDLSSPWLQRVAP